ncbi:MAG: hypothetical protein ACR2GQ_08040 [Gemmatimonadota bacterium]
MNRRFRRRAFIGVPTHLSLLVLASLALPRASSAQNAQKIMKNLEKLDIDLVGVAADLPDGQILGERNLDERGDARESGDRASPSGRVLYAWDAMASAADKVSAEHKIAVEDLARAGIPMVRGKTVELEEGMFNPNRYRMGGVLNRIDIRGKTRYEVRVTVDWTVFDSKSGEVIFAESSTGLAKGAVLGDRGEQPNTLMDSVIDSLDNVLKKKVPDAMK